MGFPKALLEYQGETFADRLVRLFADACDPVVLVLGAGAERVQAGLRRAGQARVTVNTDWPGGQITSLQCGLRALGAAPGDVLFTLVDHPAVRAETIGRLTGPGVLRIPRHLGRRGHPVWFCEELAAELLALAPGLTARDVVERHAGEIEYVDVDDPGVVLDVDDPAIFQRLAGGRA